MLEKKYRFTLDNGEKIVCSMVQFAQTYCVSKCIGFKSSVKRVAKDRYCNMTAYEQKIYESKRERAVPEYRVYAADSSFYTVTKKEYEAIFLPIKEVKEVKPILVKYKPVETCIDYSNTEISEKIDSAMTVAEKEVRKQVVELLKATGYINTSNYYNVQDWDVKVNYTDICVKVTIKENTLVFHYSGNRASNGVCDLCLLYVDINGERLMTNGHATYSFDGYMKKIGICKSVYTALYLS